MITFGEGKFKVWLEKIKTGNDLIYVLGGGEKSHIGGVVTCEPGRQSNVVRLEGHYDDIVLKPIAETACKKYKVKCFFLYYVILEQGFLLKKYITLQFQIAFSFV